MKSLSSLGWLCLLGVVSVTAACDDGGPSGPVVDMGDPTADGGPDAGGPCVDNTGCNGRICIEGECLECVQTSECTGHPSGSSCVSGACCESGTEGCVCGAGCGEDLDCEADRCVPATPCPEGTAGCPCGAGCGDDLRCVADECVDCPAGTVGCACGDGCGDDARCEADLCVSDLPVACADLDCGAQGRVCDESARDAVCGDCDLAAGFVDDAGECVMLNVCADDTDCEGGQRCLQIQDGGPRNCSDVPECAVLEASNGAGAAWSPSAGGCVPCGDCGGDGVTGLLWPTTTARGECVCETLDGYFFDVALDTGAQRACDTDGDGWVQLTAQRFVDSDDLVLSENARCTVTQVDAVILQNERGEQLRLEPDALGWDGPQPRYEAPLTDRGESGEDVIPNWGEIAPTPAQLNPLTKVCSGVIEDFNGNGFSDVQEFGRMAPLPGNEWAEPWFRLAHFIELHTHSFEDGVLTIAEIQRCGDDFALGYTEPASDHWQQCERRRPSDFTLEDPAFDFGEYVCDAEVGSCPGLSVDELVPAGAFPVQTCSGPPTDRFTGMLHHSQFSCVLLAQEGAVDAGTNQRRFDDDSIEVHTCALGAEGPECALAAERPSVGWALAKGSSPARPTVEDPDPRPYVRGCRAECDTVVGRCPAFPEAGCNVRAFGQAECNLCRESGDPCQTGLPGVCDDGVNFCPGDVRTCGLTPLIADRLGRDVLDTSALPDDAAIFALSDAFGGPDENCDGFSGRVSTAIFVDLARANRGNGTADSPFRSVQRALEGARDNAETDWTIYLRGQPPARVPALSVPSNVIEIVGGVDDCAPELGHAIDGCPGPAPTRLTTSALHGITVEPGATTLTLTNIELTVAPSPAYDGNDGEDNIGLVLTNRDVHLANTQISVADATAGRPADDGADGANGISGDRGDAGCRVSALLCRAECPEDYWDSGRGAACACGGGDSCGGGDGGEGGYPRNACMPEAIGDNPPRAGRAGRGSSAGLGGAANTTICGAEDPAPAISVGGDALMPGADGEPAVPIELAGFFTADGWTGFAGQSGRRGRNGSGGGGGGGGHGRGIGGGMCPRRGGHGAGGGSGGCAGAAGNGGGAGGASIGVLATNGRLTLDAQSTVTAGLGGVGGDGAQGGLGGGGGRGARADAPNELQGEASPGANGGDGSRGGHGGPGGGGASGPSAALVYVGFDASNPAGLNGVLNCAAPSGPGAGGDTRLGDEGPDGPVGVAAPDYSEHDCVVVATDTVCVNDTHCEGAQYCVDGDCVSALADGAACAAHFECESSYCDGERDECAPQLALYARGCVSDRGCASGVCALPAGVCLQPCAGNPDCVLNASPEFCNSDEQPVCQSRVGAGDQCDSNDHCRSNFCDGVCINPCDSTDDCVSDEYCDENRCVDRIARGDDCPGADTCRSGLYCSEGNRCLDKLENGQGCALRGGDAACISGNCNTICVACEGNDECPDGEYCSLGGVNQCERIGGEGDACTNGEDDGCEGALICDQGECRAACNNDNACQGRAFCDDDEGVGCFCRAERACKRGLDVGEACDGDRICRDDDECVGVVCRDCERLANGTSPGCQNGQVCDQRTCINPVADGGGCARDDQCARGSQCVDQVCRRECDDNGDCDDGDYCRTPDVGVDRCEPQVGLGGNCRQDDACIAGRVCDNSNTCSECRTVGGGAYEGCDPDEWCETDVNPNRCRAKRATGEDCGQDRQCLYDQCTLGRVCRDCGNDDDCADHPDGPACDRGENPNRCVGYPTSFPCTEDRHCETGFCSTASTPPGAAGRCSLCASNADCVDQGFPPGSSCGDTGAGFDSCMR